MKKKLSITDKLVVSFLEKAKEHSANFELIRVLKSRTFKIANSNVLIRASSEGNTRYFFGINYLTLEEIANLDNPFIAFICGNIDRTIIIPAKVFFSHIHQISHDRNGEYKINLDKDLNIVLSGRGNRLECSHYLNNWQLLLSPPEFGDLNQPLTIEDSLHSILQGRLLEIGKVRGFQTFCPDKSKKFNDRKLEEISSIGKCPELQFADYNLLRQIDVIWFKQKGGNLIPEYAFEVELSTGVWSGVGRLATLIDYSNVKLYVIANDSKKYNQVINSLSEYKDRYRFVTNELVGELYSAEKNLKQLRINIGI